MSDVANRTENVRVDPSQVSLKPPTELSQPTSAVSRYSKLHSVVPTSSVAGERERECTHRLRTELDSDRFSSVEPSLSEDQRRDSGAVVA